MTISPKLMENLLHQTERLPTWLVFISFGRVRTTSLLPENSSRGDAGSSPAGWGTMVPSLVALGPPFTQK